MSKVDKCKKDQEGPRAIHAAAGQVPVIPPPEEQGDVIPHKVIDPMIEIMEDDGEKYPMDWYMPLTAMRMMNITRSGYMPPEMPLQWSLVVLSMVVPGGQPPWHPSNLGGQYNCGPGCR